MKDNERSGMIEKDADVMWDIHGRGYEGLQVDSGQEQTPLQQKLDDFGNLLAKVLMGFVSQMSKDVQRCPKNCFPMFHKLIHSR